MSDSTSGTALQREQNVGAPDYSMRDDATRSLPMEGHHRQPARRAVMVLFALALLFAGVVGFFAVLRILFQPYILGGPGIVLVVVPLSIIAAGGFLFFGAKILMRASRHSRHS